MTIPMHDLATQYAALRETINARIQKVLDHNQFIMGPEVGELEERLQAYTGSEHCMTVASGTDALLIALMALGISPGDEVITTPFSFIATAEVIALVGAKPVFVDVESETCNLDAGKLEAAVTSRTRAIMPVSLFGQPCDMQEINAIAARHALPVIEDAAQSFGASYHDRKSCNLSTIGCTSFFPTKPLGCYGDGGAIFTNDAALATACREIRIHGQGKRYFHTRIGIGGRMDTIQCAVVLAKLERFDWELEARREKAEWYDELLAPLGDKLRLPSIRADRSSAYAQYTIQSGRRDELRALLQAHGVPTAVHYPRPIHKQPAYAGLCDNPTLPVAELLADRVLSLPMHADLGPATQKLVCSALLDCLAQVADEINPRTTGKPEKVGHGNQR